MSLEFQALGKFSTDRIEMKYVAYSTAGVAPGSLSTKTLTPVGKVFGGREDCDPPAVGVAAVPSSVFVPLMSFHRLSFGISYIHHSRSHKYSRKH